MRVLRDLHVADAPRKQTVEVRAAYLTCGGGIPYDLNLKLSTTTAVLHQKREPEQEALRRTLLLIFPRSAGHAPVLTSPSAASEHANQRRCAALDAGQGGSSPGLVLDEDAPCASAAAMVDEDNMMGMGDTMGTDMVRDQRSAAARDSRRSCLPPLTNIFCTELYRLLGYLFRVTLASSTVHIAERHRPSL